MSGPRAESSSRHQAGAIISASRRWTAGRRRARRRRCSCSEADVHREENEQQQRSAPVDEGETQQPSGREHRAGEAELLPHVEPVHGEMIAEPRLRNVQNHRVAPVGLRDVEPESLEGFTDAVRRVRQEPERSKVPRVLKRSGRGADRRHRDDAWGEHRPPAARRRRQKKNRVAGQQQDHREVVAEPEREHGEEQEQSASRGCSPIAGATAESPRRTPCGGSRPRR